MATVLIVDDHAAVRAGLSALIDAEAAFEVIATAPDAETGATLAAELAPDLVVADVHLPGEDGLGLALRLDGATPRPRIVLYSAFADPTLGVLAAVAGADSVVDKSDEPENLLAVLEWLADGRRSRPPVSAGALQTVGAALEPEDLPVLGMLVHGIPADEVATTLGMSRGWLQARRWAILRRVSPRRTRREPAVV